jgi:nicotinate phosphoribosyltransferase
VRRATVFAAAFTLTLSAAGVAEAEVVGAGVRPAGSDTAGPREGETRDRPLLVPLVRGGDVVGRESLDDARARHHAARAELPVQARSMAKGDPVIPTVSL